MSAGRLRLRAVLEAPEDVSDEAGGIVGGWREVGALSVAVEMRRIDPGERFDAREAVATHRVACRFRADIRRGMRLALGARRLAILAVSDPEERGRYLRLDCREEA
jgi:SPP1 family predicted phage head-tail adaptor